MTLSSFDQIVKFLEQHENSQRIKKLIFFACKNEWENDQDTLDRFKLEELIQELSSLNPTMDHLTSSLSIAVKSLSKPKQYSIIASIIVKEIQKLYLTSDQRTKIILQQPNQEESTRIILQQPNQEESTGIIFQQPNQEESTGVIFQQPNQEESTGVILQQPSQEEDSTGVIFQQPNRNIPIFYSPEKISSNLSSKSSGSSKKSQYNQFDLRQNIMRYTNPLRVKVILFSALYRKFTFNEEDWSNLKAEELDNLLRELFDSCATIKEIESKINNTVISLGNPAKNNQASSVIIRIMRSLYSDIPASTNSYKSPNSYSSQKTNPPANTNYQPAKTKIEDDDDYDYDDDDSNTCQITVPPI